MQTGRPQLSINLNLITSFPEVLRSHYTTRLPSLFILNTRTSWSTDVAHAHGLPQGVAEPGRSDIASVLSVAIDALVAPGQGCGVILQVDGESSQQLCQARFLLLDKSFFSNEFLSKKKQISLRNHYIAILISQHFEHFTDYPMVKRQVEKQLQASILCTLFMSTANSSPASQGVVSVPRSCPHRGNPFSSRRVSTAYAPASFMPQSPPADISWSNT